MDAKDIVHPSDLPFVLGELARRPGVKARGALDAAQSAQVALDLPWPPADLNPNRARSLHWAARREATALYRRECFVVAHQAILGRIRHSHNLPLTPPVSATVVFWMPDRRRRDLDNLLAAMKPAWDGLVDAGLLADDNADQLSITLKPPEYGGRAIAHVHLVLAYNGYEWKA